MSIQLHPVELVQVRNQQHVDRTELKKGLSDQLSADVEKFLNGGGIIEVIGTPEKTEFLGNTDKSLMVAVRRCNKLSVVEYIKKHPNCTLAEIQGHLGISAATVTKSIQRIDEKGWELIVDTSAKTKRFSFREKE